MTQKQTAGSARINPRESFDFNSKRSRAVRVQTVNMSAVLLVAGSALLADGAQDEFFYVDLAEGGGEGTLGLRQRGNDDVIHLRRGVQFGVGAIFDRAGRAQDLNRGDGSLIAPQFVAAAWTANPSQDSVMHQGLQNGFEVSWG